MLSSYSLITTDKKIDYFTSFVTNITKIPHVPLLNSKPGHVT